MWRCPMLTWIITPDHLGYIMTYGKCWGVFAQLSRMQGGPWKGNSSQRWQLFLRQTGVGLMDVITNRHMIVFVWEKELCIIFSFSPSRLYWSWALMMWKQANTSSRLHVVSNVTSNTGTVAITLFPGPTSQSSFYTLCVMFVKRSASH